MHMFVALWKYEDDPMALMESLINVTVNQSEGFPNSQFSFFSGSCEPQISHEIVFFEEYWL